MTNKETPGNKPKVIGATGGIAAAKEDQAPDRPPSPEIAPEEKKEAVPAASSVPRSAANKPRTGLFILFVLIIIGVAAAAWWFTSRGAKAPGGAEKPAAGNSGGAPSGCQLWSKISADDAGKELCAYGVVKTAFTGKGVTYIRFSDGKDAFRFMNSKGKDFSKTVGQCVQAKGVVKTYGKMPYIEIGDKLDSCK